MGSMLQPLTLLIVCRALLELTKLQSGNRVAQIVQLAHIKIWHTKLNALIVLWVLINHRYKHFSVYCVLLELYKVQYRVLNVKLARLAATQTNRG